MAERYNKKGRFQACEADDGTLLTELRTLFNTYSDIFNADKVNELGTRGLPALHFLVFYGKWQCAEFLLSGGAKPSKPGKPEASLSVEFGADLNETWNALDVFVWVATFGRAYDADDMREVFEFYHLNESSSGGKVRFVSRSGDVWDDDVCIEQLFQRGFNTNQQIMRTLATNSLRSQLSLFHVPATNGVILCKLSRILRWPLQERLWDGNDHVITKKFCRELNDPATGPGYGLLKYKAFGYDHQLIPVRDNSPAWKYQAIVFPCLVLRTVACHETMRTTIKALNEQFPILDGVEFNKIQLERTIDEAYYPGLTAATLKERNVDQVVRRERRAVLKERHLKDRRKHAPMAEKESWEPDSLDLPILTVAQLWLWRADNVVVSAFASEPLFGPSKDDPIEMKSSWTNKSPWTESPDLLISQLLLSRVKAFGRPVLHDGSGLIKFAPVLNIFENAVVSAFAAVDRYTRSGSVSELNLKQEADFIHTISDIRSELAMIQDVLNQQEEVLSALQNDQPRLQFPPIQGQTPVDHEEKLQERWKEWDKRHGTREILNIIDSYRKQTTKIDRDAERIEQVILNMLNVKRTAASQEQAQASEKIARASKKIAEDSMQEAKDSKRLSLLVIGFTVMTIIFTPLSFVASLFAINIDTLASLKYTPGNQSPQNTAINTTDKPDEVYHGGAMAGIFLGVEALSFLITGLIGWRLWHYLVLWLQKENTRPDGEEPEVA